MTEVKIVLDSVTEEGCRLITYQLQYPRFIHSQILTHRTFSRNSSSSRAIPVKRMMKNIAENPVMPSFWGKNQAGMMASEEVEDIPRAEMAWRKGLANAMVCAQSMMDAGVHKQIANRVLEPWMHITTLITATEWDNFFNLRCKDAQPEISDLACLMRDAQEESIPEELGFSEWHLPMITAEERAQYPSSALLKLSVARCARISYLTHDGRRDLDKDYLLHDRLQKSGHWSPFEHQAFAQRGQEMNGNFRGWCQYRKVMGK